MIELKPMLAQDFGDYLNRAVRNYAADHLRTEGGTEGAAFEYARDSFDTLLPDGEATPGHYLYTVFSVEKGVNVGVIWVGVITSKQVRRAHVFDIFIDEPYRRMGYAKQAFQAIEGCVRELGLSEISLHVFGYNDKAYALYRQLGYRPTHISMVKTLESSE